MAEENSFEGKPTRILENQKALPNVPRKNFLARSLPSFLMGKKKGQEGVKYDSKDPMHEQIFSIADLQNLSQTLVNLSYDERAKELIDALSRHSNLLMESSKNPVSIDFATSLDITRNFFRYYKNRVEMQRIYDKHPKRNRTIDPNTHQFADFAASFLFSSMQGIEAKMNSAQSLDDKALLAETVSNLARFGKDDQRIEAVNFLTKHFDHLLIELRSEYTKDEIPFPTFKYTFFALGTIFENGTPEQFEAAIQIIMRHFRGEDIEMKKLIADKILAGIEDKDIANRVTKIIVNGYNINPEETVRNWSTSTMKGFETLVAGKNLKQIIDLESRIPGICSVLYSEFGITDFARYPRDLLITQYEDRDRKDNSPYGVVVLPKADWNEAYYNKVNVLKGLHSRLKGRFGIRAFETENVLELVGILNQSRKKWGKISFAIIGGHGTPESIRFGALDNARSLLKKEDVEKPGASAIKIAFVENPTIILSSCSTGELGGIGQEISKIGAKVIAPPVPTYPESIDPIFLDNGNIDFNVVYSETSSSAYNMGKPESVT